MSAFDDFEDRLYKQWFEEVLEEDLKEEVITEDDILKAGEEIKNALKTGKNRAKDGGKIIIAHEEFDRDDVTHWGDDQ